MSENNKQVKKEEERHDKPRSFLLEFIVIGSIVFILAGMGLRQINVTYDRAREAETRANLKVIYTALSRYSTDHSGAYPTYILGGDLRGWSPDNGCRASVFHSQDRSTRLPEDPLIKYSYLSDYPTNPFLDEDRAVRILEATGGSHDPGCGDVRFGYYGNRMGNCLDDPKVLFDRCSHHNDYKKIPTGLAYTSLVDPANKTGVICEDRYNSFFSMGGYPLSAVSGINGVEDKNDELVKYWWPGEFFYRVGGDFFVGGTNPTGPEYEDIWGWPYMRCNRYIMGCYGSLQTDGFDVIRLTTKNGDAACLDSSYNNGELTGEFYQDHSDITRAASHPDYNVLIRFSAPEVFGGGERGLMPQFPYYQVRAHTWIAGAPDGFPDGVILVIFQQSFCDPEVRNPDSSVWEWILSSPDEIWPDK